MGILDAVTRDWVPGNHREHSMWAGGREDAAAFFRKFPELERAFCETPDETARRWSERTGAPPETGTGKKE